MIVSLPFLLGACASMSGLQTARTLEPGKAESTFGGGYYTSGSLISSIEENSTAEDLSIPYMEYTYRQGLTDKIDAGIKLTIIGTAVVDGKYKLYENDKFAIATGAGLGYLNIESDNGVEKSESSIIDIILPLYTSYDVKENLSLYLIPKYILRSSSGNVSGSTNLVGATTGLKFGKEWGTYVELSHFISPGTDFSLNQAQVSLFWKPEKKLFSALEF